MPNECAKKLFEVVAHAYPVTSLTIVNTSKQVEPLVVTGCKDGSLTMWTARKPTHMTQLIQAGQYIDQSGCSVVRRSSVENEILAGFEKGGIAVLGINSNKETWSNMDAHEGSVLAVERHPWCPCIASCSKSKECNSIKLWDTRKSSFIKAYRGHADTVEYLRYSPDGRLLASSSSNGQVKLWDLNAGKEFAHLDVGYKSTLIEFHPTEYLLATCSLSNEPNCLSMWCLDNMTKLKSEAFSDPDAKNFTSMCFVSPNEGNKTFTSDIVLLAARPRCLDAFDSECLNVYWNLSTTWNFVFDIYKLDDYSANIIVASFMENNLSVHQANMNMMRCAPRKSELPKFEYTYDQTQSFNHIQQYRNTDIFQTEDSLDNLILAKKNDISGNTLEHEQIMQLIDSRFNAYVNIPSSIDASINNIKDIINSLQRSNDPILTSPVLQMFLDDMHIWTLDFVCLLCPLLCSLVNLSHCSTVIIVQTLLQCVKRILAGYGQVICDVLRRNDLGKDMLGVNPILEERYEKCEKCKMHLYKIYCAVTDFQLNNKEIRNLKTLDSLLELQKLI
ncbi:hypothetical protein GJ496_003349 [Pomphorhynchus laevis]|nr:hypothetical protein GJ496_003349 [Pomphorhynchus laevis]